MALLDLLSIQLPSALDPVIDTLAAIGSKSADSCIELLLALEAKQLVDQPIGARLAKATLKHSELSDYELVYGLVDRLARRTIQGQSILLWLLRHVHRSPRSGRNLNVDRLGSRIT